MVPATCRRQKCRACHGARKIMVAPPSTGPRIPNVMAAVSVVEYLMVRLGSYLKAARYRHLQ